MIYIAMQLLLYVMSCAKYLNYHCVKRKALSILYFVYKNWKISCPNFGTLSKRLKRLGLKSPRYKKHEKPDDDLAAIEIDSSGLKRFGRDEWHQEKHKVSAKCSRRKLHISKNG